MGHKGYAARDQYTRKYKAVRQGKASRWIALYPVEIALKKAGLA